MSTVEELAALFKQQSNDDLKAAYTLYKNVNYGNAAFHAQQALEKTLKNVMMELDLVNQDQESLRKLRHKPVTKIIKKLMTLNSNFKSKNNAIDRIRLAACKRLPDLMKLFLAQPKSPLSYKIWWKISLEIELTAEEEKKGRDDIEKKLNNLTNDLQEIAVAVLGTSPEVSKLASQLFSKTQTDFKTSQRVPKTTSKKSTMAEYSEIQRVIRTVFSGLFSPQITKKLDKKTIGMLAISSWIAIHGWTILSIAPHEQLGRYPDEISPGVRSYSLYKDNADQLYALIRKVDEAIKELYAISERCMAAENEHGPLLL